MKCWLVCLGIQYMKFSLQESRRMEKYGNDIEKEEEVVSKNGSLGTVWKQCCQSPWARQTQKSKE